jgi:hypothetical protein
MDPFRGIGLIPNTQIKVMFRKNSQMYEIFGDIIGTFLGFAPDGRVGVYGYNRIGRRHMRFIFDHADFNDIIKVYVYKRKRQ